MGRNERAAILLAVSLTLIPLFGCESILEREFESVSKHEDTEKAVSFPDDGITDYYDLKNVVLNMVRSGLSEKLIRISSYNGGLDEDLRNISQNLSENDALTAYTVSSIVYEQTRVLTYQEVLITIRYSKTEQERDGIIDVINLSDFERKMSEEIRTYPQKLVFSFGYYSESDFSIEDRFMKAYYNSPDTAYGLSGYKIQMYPESGIQRVAEISIEYFSGIDALKEKSGLVSAEAQKVSAQAKNSAQAVTAFNIYRHLLDTVEFNMQAARVAAEMGGAQPKSDPYTAYGALIDKTAAPEGFAIAFKKICDLSGIECTVISGTAKDQTPVVWNLVRIDGEWYHIDPATAKRTGNYAAYFCVSDEAIKSTHSWDESGYPAAEGTQYSYGTIEKNIRQ